MEAKKETAVIAACKCKHTQQDAMYGAGKRVHNLSAGTGGQGKTKTQVRRCTVCGTESQA